MSVYPIGRDERGLPLYRQIHDCLLSEIRQQYQSGDCLPSELVLAERFGVNRHTVRRAVDDLVAEGLVARRHGVGVMVLEPAINYALNQSTRFTQTLEELGHQTSSKVIRKQIINASQSVAENLAIEQGCEVIFIETLRFVAEKPFCLISHYLPLNGFEYVQQHYEQGSLHGFLQQHADVKLQRISSLVSAVLPSNDDAVQLRMPKHDPVLRVKSVNIDAETQTPVEYAVTRFRGDSAQLSFKP